jgi:AcrR family transcriptional regulator
MAAQVSRRSVFHHFATKDAILFDHLVVRREVALERLSKRPRSEPSLVSLHAILRDLCKEGYDRQLLALVREVIATDPQIAITRLPAGSLAFEKSLVATLELRDGEHRSTLELSALTLMATGWLVTASHIYLTEGRQSLVECFDEVVAVCVRSGARDLGSLLGPENA